jgi:transposase-like protein
LQQGAVWKRTVEKQRYSEKFKARMVQRMVGPGRLSANALSKEVGVAQPTLSLWLRQAGNLRGVKADDDARPPARRPEDWSPREKLAAVLEAEGISEAELGGWLRRRGLKEGIRCMKPVLSGQGWCEQGRADGESSRMGGACGAVA